MIPGFSTRLEWECGWKSCMANSKDWSSANVNVIELNCKNNIFQKKTKGSNVSAIIAEDNTITDPIEIAENFNNFFTSICTKL